MNTLIIDNESPAREFLKTSLKAYCPELNIIGEANGVATGLKAILSLKPELVFLDVEMDDGTGMDLMGLLPEVTFHVIFYTAHEKYAMDALKMSALDFLLKPVDPDELLAAVTKAKNRANLQDQLQKLQALVHNYGGAEPHEKKLILKDRDHIFLVKVGEIIRCEGEGGYSTFYTAEGEKIMVSKTLKTYEKPLVEKGFFRVHASHLINLSEIRKISKRDGGYVIMSDGKEVSISRRRKDDLMTAIDRLA